MNLIFTILFLLVSNLFISGTIYAQECTQPSCFQPRDKELTGLANQTSASDRVPYFIDADGNMDLAPLTAFGRSVIGAANAGEVNTILGVSLITTHPRVTVATLPAVPVTNEVVVVTDALAASSCIVNGGTTNVTCQWTGAAWVAIGGGGGGGSVAGTDTQVQFNDSNIMAGDAGLTYNKTTDTLTVTGDVIVAGQSVCQEDGTNCPSGGAPAFNTVTAGTNTNKLVVGTGGSLGVTGTGTITPQYTPSGSIAATTVQGAIAELDSEKQPLDADLTALAGNSTAGFWAASTNAARTLTAGTGIGITNPAGVAGNPTFSLTTAYDCITASATTQVLFNNAGNCDGIAGFTVNASTAVVTASGFAGPLTGNVTSSGQSTFTGSLLVPGKSDGAPPLINEVWRSVSAPLGLKWYDGAIIQRAIKDTDFASTNAGILNRTGVGAYSILAPTDDTLLIGSGTVWESKVLGTCRPSSGNGWYYDASTNTLGCEAIVSSGLASLTEDADSVNSAKALEIGITPYVRFVRGVGISTDRIYTLAKDVAGDVALTTGTSTSGALSKFDSSGRLVPAGPALKTCIIENDMQSASPLTDANLTGRCDFDVAVTLVEIAVYASSGTPSVLLERWRPNGGAVADVLTGALATGSAGAYACSKTTGVAGIAGITCTNTLQNTALNAGDVIRIKSATAGGVATWHHIKITASY